MREKVRLGLEDEEKKKKSKRRKQRRGRRKRRRRRWGWQCPYSPSGGGVKSSSSTFGNAVGHSRNVMVYIYPNP